MISGNWSNLGADNIYLVTSGIYNTKSEADIVLKNVKKYFPDAFVMYSGTYVEYDPVEAVDYVYESDNEISRIENLISLAQIKELTYADLVGYTSFELSAARNGIYAYNGYVFQSKEWENFFPNYFAWYFPDSNFKVEYMSQLETKNAGIIEKYENEVYGGVFKFN